MAYVKQTWHDLPATDTPITAAALGHIEDGVAASEVEGYTVIAASGTAQTLTRVARVEEWEITLNNNCTFTLAGAPAASQVGTWVINLIQGTPGSRVPTISGVDWGAAGVPIWSTVTGKVDQVVVTQRGTAGTKRASLVAKGFSS